MSTHESAIRTLFVLPAAAYAPDTLLTGHLLAHLPRSAVEPAVCFLEDGPLTNDWAARLDIGAHAVAPQGKPGSRRRAAQALAALVRTLGAQVLHAVGPAAQLVASRAAKATGVPGMWTQPGVTHWGRLRDLRASLSATRAVLIHSDESERAQRRMLLGRKRVRRVTAGIPLPDRLPEHRRAAAREALDIPGDAIVAASVGPLDPAEVHETFLRAATSLCNARPRARLVIAGTTGAPGTSAALIERIKAAGLESRTQLFAPWQLGTALDATDIAVHGGASPAWEPLIPVGLLQALAAGAAVIVQDGPLVDELVLPGETALAVPPGHHEELALLLLALADDPRRRTRLSRAAAASARARHDADRMAAEVLALYRELVAA